jgi:hypothetical protein
MSMPDPRNEPTYDTWDRGMEPIPGDKTWATPKTKTKDDGGRNGELSPTHVSVTRILAAEKPIASQA